MYVCIYIIIAIIKNLLRSYIFCSYKDVNIIDLTYYT